MSTRVHVRECEIGQGLFALKRIRAGEMILVLEGYVITVDQVRAMAEKQGNTVQIGSRHYIDVEPPGLYINHSCQPNTGLMNDIILVALRDIRAHEELRFDYSTTMSEGDWTMRCRCGAAQCRGMIEDFHLLSETLKQGYLARGIVQQFIVEEHYAQIEAASFAKARYSGLSLQKVARG